MSECQNYQHFYEERFEETPVVEHLSHNPKVEGSNPAPGTGRGEYVDEIFDEKFGKNISDAEFGFDLNTSFLQ